MYFTSRELATLEEVLRCLDTLDELANSLERVVQTLATEDDSAVDEEFRRRRKPARPATQACASASRLHEGQWGRPAPRRMYIAKGEFSYIGMQ
jgi:hypothetical protein